MTTIGTPALWGGFLLFVLAMLAVDLGIFHRKSHAVGFKEAAIWSGVWVTLALIFNVGVWHWFGPEAATQFLTGYLVEKTLSVDNIFVFVVIFSSLAIPAIYQHRVLFWGIITALILRAIMIFVGTAMLARFHWLIYVFGGFLVLTGLKLFWSWKRSNGEENTGESRALAWLRRVIPSTEKLDGERFFVRHEGKILATPLMLALLLVEITDVIFALDSIPAIFAITTDPFIVFTSNIFAILGLRSLFFLLAGMVDRFVYLKVGLAGVLAFVGVKMMIVDVYKIPPAASLAVIAGMIGASVVASLWKTKGGSKPSSPVENV